MSAYHRTPRRGETSENFGDNEQQFQIARELLSRFGFGHRYVYLYNPVNEKSEYILFAFEKVEDDDLAISRRCWVAKVRTW